ncbi:MAG: AAA family ATPase [Myxococcales bacterium]|nr:AAA family ATPase [Myxococcales bacterium]
MEQITSACETEDLIKAQYPILYIVSSEEERVEEALTKIAERRFMKLAAWSCTRGFVKLVGTIKGGDAKQPDKALDFIAGAEGKGLYILRDFHEFLKTPDVVRRLRDLAHDLKKKPETNTVLILSPVLKIPAELEKEIAVIDWDLPNRVEMDEVVGRAIARIPAGQSAGLAETLKGREQVVDAALGLTKVEAENVFLKSVVRNKTIHLPTILSEKKHIIRKSGILEYYEATEKLAGIGGLETLKQWLTKRRNAYSHEARDFGLPLPKGILLIGVPGCGKSLMAKAVGSEWQMPLLRLDVGKIFGGLVGSSEENIRKAIKTAEATAPSILWLDELEKGFSGTGSSNMSDGGTTSRVFGTFITWLQEKTAAVFVMATANNVMAMPPELLRKGRFDEIFFVDLPTPQERRMILEIHLKKNGRSTAGIDLDKLVDEMPDFSGSEIEQVVVSAMYDAFDVNPGERELTTEQLLRSSKEIVPLAVTMHEGIVAMRQWARTRARMASPERAAQESPFNIEMRKLEV